MMQKYAPIAFCFFLLFFTNVGYAKTINIPKISASEAIGITEKYIKENNVDVSRHFLAKIEYFNLHNEYEKPFWRIEYRPLTGETVVIKGGQILFIVYQDGSIVQSSGE